VTLKNIDVIAQPGHFKECTPNPSLVIGHRFNDLYWNPFCALGIFHAMPRGNSSNSGVCNQLIQAYLQIPKPCSPPKV
jgi:hypothetical protein